MFPALTGLRVEELSRSDVRIRAPVEPSPALGPESLVTRLCRGKVGRWMLGYFAVSWLILQLVDVLGEAWGWSGLLQRAISLVLGLGTLPAFVLAWFHGERGRQRVCTEEVAILAAVLLVTATVLWQFFSAAV